LWPRLPLDMVDDSAATSVTVVGIQSAAASVARGSRGGVPGVTDSRSWDGEGIQEKGFEQTNWAGPLAGCVVCCQTLGTLALPKHRFLGLGFLFH
jgi:hypothetical protein